MPYVDFGSEDDYASIFYTTNSYYGNVGGFNPENPTIVVMHPTFLDTTWLDNHFGDPRLNDNYNLIAFDMRCVGRSVSRHSGKHDSWVEAADLAFCAQVRCSLSPPEDLCVHDLDIRSSTYTCHLFISWHLRESRSWLPSDLPCCALLSLKQINPYVLTKST